MFTGIVSEVGRIRDVVAVGDGRRFTIEAPVTAAGLTVGDSVAVDGACLTAVAVDERGFGAEAVAETLHRTTLDERQAGDRVDLERPVAAEGRFDGHLVQGHVDGVGTVVVARDAGGARLLRVGFAPELARYVVEKGSVAVDGVSLTVTATSAPLEAPAWFEVVVIPHTLEVTVLGERGPGDRVNIEVDLIAKYVERWMEARA